MLSVEYAADSHESNLPKLPKLSWKSLVLNVPQDPKLVSISLPDQVKKKKKLKYVSKVYILIWQTEN